MPLRIAKGNPGLFLTVRSSSAGGPGTERKGYSFFGVKFASHQLVLLYPLFFKDSHLFKELFKKPFMGHLECSLRHNSG